MVNKKNWTMCERDGESERRWDRERESAVGENLDELIEFWKLRYWLTIPLPLVFDCSWKLDAIEISIWNYYYILFLSPPYLAHAHAHSHAHAHILHSLVRFLSHSHTHKISLHSPSSWHSIINCLFWSLTSIIVIFFGMFRRPDTIVVHF